MDMNEFVKGMAEIEAQVAREAEILFDGKDDCSDEEAEIILSSKLDFERKLAKLRVLRGAADNRLNC
jgi:hypothetical protein